MRGDISSSDKVNLKDASHAVMRRILLENKSHCGLHLFFEP